ncbi:SPOR domain-containing protein [Marinomonas sp. TW1]|uniref:SPOR domain-containing protein n=1 Tax=Marinomonas sp. TW1 TaxID=1561203 RepID=UPI0007AFDA57|nr:SPOR domain-containing protein [Marinomonas sp. TW1]KZN14080.1 sporulation protein [Marinomonas sp. TW1]
MGITKKLIVVQMGLVLAACSSTGEKNTFMSYEDLQTKVRTHEEQWQTAQVKLDKIDALEAEVASLKQEKLALEAANEMPDSSESTMIDVDDSMAATNVAPLVETSSETMDSDSSSMSSEAMSSEAMSSKAMSSETMPAAPLAAATQDDMNMAQAAPLASTEVSQSSTQATSSAMSNEGYGVQLAAYSNRNEAVRGWQVLMKNDPTAYDGLVPKVNQKDVKGRTMYQLKVGPFLQKSFSVDFCMMLKEKGKDCMVTQYNGEAF